MPIIKRDGDLIIGQAVGLHWRGEINEGKFWIELHGYRYLSNLGIVEDTATWFDSLDHVDKAIAIYRSRQRDSPLSKARRLRDIALMAYSPPGKGFGDETVAVKTSALITLAFVFGLEIFEGVELTEGQRSAIESGLKVLESEA